MNERMTRARVLPAPRSAAAVLPHSGVDPSQLVRVRPGAYVLSAEWEELFAEGRLRTLAEATYARVRSTGVTLSHATAAAEWFLPLYRVRSDRIDVIVPGKHTRKNSRDVLRHHVPLPDEDVVVLDGRRVTSLERTVYDVIRTVNVEAALACFDAALRLVAWDAEERTYDHVEAEAFRGRIWARIRRHSGARGIRQARLVTEIADGRAQLPGESISRLWMMQLGVPTPELQFRVDFADGGFALLDFAWPALGLWSEFDGEAKYTDPAYTGGRPLEHILADQREREARIIQATGWRVERWGFDVLRSFAAFAVHLRAIGLRRT